MRTLYEFENELGFADGTAADYTEDFIDRLIDEAIDLLDEDTDYIVFPEDSPVDDRFEIFARSRYPSTRLFPYNTICRLECDRGGGFRQCCTGTLIAPQVVLTARHCLQRVTQMRVSPGAGRPSATSTNIVTPASPSQIIYDRP
jgi:V8-like Glu-specific endopeptidase